MTLGKGILLKSYYQSERGIPVDWSKIKREYIKGGTSYRNLAEKYGVSFSSLQKVAAKENWAELRKKKEEETEIKIIESLSDKEADRAKRLLSVTDKLLDRIEGLVEEFTAAEVALDRTTLKQITGALLDIQKIQGSKDALDIEEQRARIAKLKKEAEDEDKTSEVVITIEGGEDSWAE